VPFRLARLVVGVALVSWSPSGLLAAQDTTHARTDTVGHFHIGLTIHDYGISFGNAPRINGVRLNVQDADLERVNGINVTVWKPREPLTGTVNGVQIGLLPGSGEVNGVGVGLAGLVADGSIHGIGFGGLGAVANGDLKGVVFGGLGAVANRDIWGVAVSGLGTVANRDVVGLAFAGLGTVANRDVTGVGLGGLALVANGSITGIGVGGLAVVANGRITGLGVGGLAVVANESIRGIAVAGYSVDTHEMDGVAVSAYTRVRGLQRGLAIGIYNSAYELHGVQIGVLNRAKNNKAPFKILPLLNVHL
jgi:hypothetical protein